METTTPLMDVRVRGPAACFTRPELKTERVSYEVMTPSAARGILESILWKPAIRWQVDRIKVLKPIRFFSLKRNEVNSVIPADSVKTAMRTGALRPFFADEDRAQRNTVALRDVDYIIEAHFEFTARAGTEDNSQKFAEMFHRRVERGQSFLQPYFGCREFAAEFLTADGSPKAIPDSRDLGRMLLDVEFGDRNRPLWFEARLHDGILEVPPTPRSEVAA